MTRNLTKQKLVLLSSLVTLFFLSIPLSYAADDLPHSAGITVGQVWPSGDFGKDVEGAVAPGLFYEYAASDVFSVYAEALRSNHSSDSLKLWNYAAGIKSVLIYIDKLAPYAFVGMGLYHVDRNLPATNETATKTLFGFNFGLGADLDLNDRVFVGMDFQFHNVFTGSVDLPGAGHTTVSGRWSGLFMRAGYRF